MGNEIRRETGFGSDRYEEGGSGQAGGSIHDCRRQWRAEADVGGRSVFGADYGAKIGQGSSVDFAEERRFAMNGRIVAVLCGVWSLLIGVASADGATARPTSLFFESGGRKIRAD